MTGSDTFAGSAGVKVEVVPTRFDPESIAQRPKDAKGGGRKNSSQGLPAGSPGPESGSRKPSLEPQSSRRRGPSERAAPGAERSGRPLAGEPGSAQGRRRPRRRRLGFPGLPLPSRGRGRTARTGARRRRSAPGRGESPGRPQLGAGLRGGERRTRRPRAPEPAAAGGLG
ncbi:putative uncharacterized protein WWC2-AS2 [Meles meles]|uniref:putative uncharacterized protein WWC2-AS2 n=1 Tax=Meles meles TaxID=9662 RepID=UPI001E699778|nr:putative uncharacterized protein WWC2-AS2 [Meles meles]